MSPTTSPIDSASLTTNPKARPTVNSVTTAAAASTGPRNSGEIVVIPWTTTPSSSVRAIRKRTGAALHARGTITITPEIRVSSSRNRKISGTRSLSSGFRASTTGIGLALAPPVLAGADHDHHERPAPGKPDRTGAGWLPEIASGPTLCEARILRTGIIDLGGNGR